jgi:hypothetical protein
VSRGKLAAPALPPRAYSYAVARVALVWLTCGAFFWLNLGGAWLIGGALTHDVLSPLHARWYWAIGLAATAFFAGHGGSIGLLDAYSQGRVRLPAQPAAASAALNPWQVALTLLVRCGLPLAAISFWLVPLIWPSGVRLQHFVWQFASVSAGLSAVLVTLRTGAPFLGQTQLALAERRFSGSAEAYLWQRHALPQALVNGLINGVVGAAIVPMKLTAAGASLSAAFVRHDIAGALCVLGLFIAGATLSYARFDRRWGVAPALGTKPWRLAKQAAQSAAIFAALTALLCALTGLGLRDVGVPTFLVGRALGCGVYCGWVAYWTARCVTNEPAT